MVSFLAEKLEREVLIPENPQFMGALGAALLASELEKPCLNENDGLAI
jgi:activator of 2-hydroxyglutaryl-CoA dehydratase